MSKLARRRATMDTTMPDFINASGRIDGAAMRVDAQRGELDADGSDRVGGVHASADSVQGRRAGSAADADRDA